MKSALILIVIFISSRVTAQDFYKYGHYVLHGKVKNKKELFFEFGQTTYLKSIQHSVVIGTDGSFEHAFPIQYHQDIILPFNGKFIRLTVFNNDTLLVTWDDNEKNSLVVQSPDPARTKELEVQVKLFIEFGESTMQLEAMDRKEPPDKRYAAINDLYNSSYKRIRELTGNKTEIATHLLIQSYFEFTNILFRQRLFPGYKLILNEDGQIPGIKSKNTNATGDYTYLNEIWFWNIPSYRDFLFDYVRFSKLFHSQSSLSQPHDFDPSRDEYYQAESSINIKSIREWFVTRSIMFGFERYEYFKVEQVYQQALPTIQNKYLQDTLQKFYTAFTRLRPGNQAPGFALIDEKGQKVSLEDFKGKVVYLDFWGVGCGPCIYEIKNHLPSLYNKYKNKDFIILNICVDADEEEWKVALLKYKPDGINLIAEGWKDNPVCQAYYINGIPHNVLIDKKGKIADNNAPRASDLIDIRSNIIDNLLK